jgi:thioesterase domain-containing protein
LGLETLGRDDNFFHLGGHSLLALTLFTRIDREFGLTLPLATLLRAPTLRSLGSLIDRELTEEKDSGPPQPILATLHSEGDLPPLFCVHGAGGGVIFYQQLVAQLPTNRPLVAIEAPGRRPGSPVESLSIPCAATRYLEAIRGRQKSGPYFLCGYSYGGVVAFEMARQLEVTGETVELLVLLDAKNPAVQTFTRGDRLRWIWNDPRAPTRISKVLALGRYLFRQAVQRIAKRPQEIGQEAGDILDKELYGSRVDAIRAYRPPPYPGKLILLRVADEDGDPFTPPRDYGWGNVCRELDVHFVPGRHHTLFTTENAPVLAKHLTEYLSRR